MKNVLVVYYSQSGQLLEIAQNIARPIAASGDIAVHFHEIKLVTPFPFPWDKQSFFNVFPESYQQVPAAIQPVPHHIKDLKYDLVLLCYQVWYLSPSIPFNSFLKSRDGQKLIENTPVVTINASRNMWIMAQEKVKRLLAECGAKLVGNIALVDRAGNLVSVVTIVRWMFTGVKNRYLGIFPLPGVSQKDIDSSELYGRVILNSLESGNFDDLQPQLVETGGVKIKPFLVTVDRTANKIFQKWSAFIISRKSSRAKWLKVFNVYLLIAIWVISPIVYILHVFTLPLKMKKIKRETLYFQGV